MVYGTAASAIVLMRGQLRGRIESEDLRGISRLMSAAASVLGSGGLWWAVEIGDAGHEHQTRTQGA